MNEGAQRAAQAEARITECKLRRSELSAGTGSSQADVARARAALRSAQERRTLAQQRLQTAIERASRTRLDQACRTLLTGSPSRTPPSYLVADADPLDLLHKHQLSADDLYRYYLSLGGELGKIEIDAYLHRLAALPRLDEMIITHSLWELSEGLG